MNILGEEIDENTMRECSTSELVEAIAGAQFIRTMRATRDVLHVASADQLAKEEDAFKLEKLARVELNQRVPVPPKPIPGAF